MTQLWLLILCLLVLGVSTQTVPSKPVTSYVLKGWVPNACTLVVCAPHERGPEKENGEQEHECLRKEIRDMEMELNACKAIVNKTLKVLLMPHGVMVGDRIFKTDGSIGNYETAKTLCLQMGAMIASPRNAEENKAVQQIVKWQNRRAVLGINDMEKEGMFVYTNGEKVGYSNWASGEPNNSGNEDCAEMHPDGQWHDRHCMLDWLIICEF